MMEKHHIDQNPYISSLCPKTGVVTDNMTRGDDVTQNPDPAEPNWGRPARVWHFSKFVFNTCQLKLARKAVLPQSLAARPG
jgi:hypothetical protein